VFYVYNGAGVSHRCGALVLAYKQAETNGAAVPNLRVLIFFSDIDMLSKPLRAGATTVGLNPLVIPAPTCNRAQFPGLVYGAGMN